MHIHHQLHSIASSSLTEADRDTVTDTVTDTVRDTVRNTVTDTDDTHDQMYYDRHPVRIRESA